MSGSRGRPVRPSPWVIALPLAAALVAAPARAADVALGDLAYTSGSVAYRIPRVVIRGTEANREELDRLFSVDSAVGLTERLRGVSADEILAPEFVVESRSDRGQITMTFRDLRVAGTKNGRIATMTAAGGRFEANGPDGLVRALTGPLTISELDLGLAGSLAKPGGPGPDALGRLYGSLAVDDVTIGDSAGMSVRLGRLVSRDVKARPTSTGWAAAFAALSSQTEPTPDRVVALLAEWAGSVALGSFEASGLGIDIGGAGQESARIARIGFAEGAPALTLDGVEIGGAEGRLTIGKVTLGADAAGGLGDIVKAGDGVDALRRALSGSGSIRLDRVALAPPDRSGVTIGTIEAALAKRQPATDGATAPPVTFSLSARDVAMPARADDPALQPLIDLGYSRLAGSLGGTVRYDEVRRELTIDKLAVHADEIGDVTLSATLGQVSPDVFQQDSALAAAALVGMRALSVDVTVENGGLADRLVDRQARLAGRKPEEIRRQYGLAAAFAVPMALGASPGARTLGEAASRFVAKPGRLTITLKSKDPAGLGLADLLAAPDPRAILDQVEVGATNQ